MKVGIIGAGFAGVEAARVMSGQGLEVTLFSAEKVPPYNRPRLPEMAFGHCEPSDIFMHNPEWYAAKGIDLRLDSEVKAFTSDFELTLKDGSHEKFDALLIASGGKPAIPGFCRECKQPYIFKLWNYFDAVRIREHLKSGNRLGVLGGGVLGVEIALRAVDKNLKVFIVERTNHILSRNFSRKACEIIEKQLYSYNIDLILNGTVSHFEAERENRILVIMEDHDCFWCNFMIVATGVDFDVPMVEAAGVKTDRRILVDKYLQTSLPGVFAAGDIARLAVSSSCSFEVAIEQGRVAGNNIFAYLSGSDMTAYQAEAVPLELKYKDFEIHAIRNVAKVEGTKIIDYNDMKTYRSRIYKGSALVGGEVVGSDTTFLTKLLNKLKDIEIY